jgi:probable DNA repair protein
MPALLTEPDLLDALARGVRLVLPSAPAARALRVAYDDRQRATGASVWESASALSWDDWTHSLWSDLVANGLELRVLLNAAQEHGLWREIIESSIAGSSLGSPDAIADLARSAWRLAASHLATARLHSTALTSDSRTFANWADSFLRLCTLQKCLSNAQLEDALRQHALTGALLVESTVLIAGFIEFTPAQAALLDALQASGAQIEPADLHAEQRPSALRATTMVSTPREELQFAARWIHVFFEDRRGADRTPRIAVLLPQPEGERGELESIFREILAPELQSIHADLSSTPWEFTAGTQLDSQPMIVDALDLLRLIQRPLPIERVSALLRSPFLGSSIDSLAVARFDTDELRRRPLLIPELDLEAVRRRAAKYAQRHAALNSPVPWLQSVANLPAMKSRSSAREFAEWAELFRSILKAANWPGDRDQTASDFETIRAWESTVDLLSTLGFRARRVSQSNAMQTLERLAHDMHIRTPLHAPIQIMRPGQTAGLTFDAVVLLRATDRAWPETPHLHPFLGWPLQRDLKLPGANAHHDAERAYRDARSLLARATHVLITSAKQDADGHLLPSPLLSQLGLTHLRPDQLLTPPTPVQPIVAERIIDDAPLPPLAAPDLRGGSNVLKLQAACGFRAFAEIRLRSDCPDVSELGLDARERGNVVHRALETFWTNTHSRDELMSLNQEERGRRLSYAVDTAFKDLAADEAWSRTYLALQRERLYNLLSRWLAFETMRSPFTVLQREERRMIDIGPLRLSLRPDRIDELENGLALVDYKTGAEAEPSNWLGDRPDDPQLPLYALLTEPGKLKALLLARIRPGIEMKWRGLETEFGILPRSGSKTLTDMDGRIEGWRRVLTVLAEDFAAGRADVLPKSLADCEHCGQRLLCRLDPSSLTTRDEEDSEEIEGANG